MKHFAGIVPPENIYNAILAIQQQFGDNRLEPHITVRPPVNVADEPGWIEAIEAVCKSFKPFTITLPATGNFGKRVLFIDVKSIPLEDLHIAMLKALKPFEKSDPKQPERQSFNPHLTLGRSWCGFTQQNFSAIETLANEHLLRQPVLFDATFIRIYHKPGGQGGYETLKDILINSG